MPLSVARRRAVWNRFTDAQLGGREAGWNKADLRAAVGAVDDWLDANGPAVIAAIDAAAPTLAGLSNADKLALVLAVVEARAGRF